MTTRKLDIRLFGQFKPLLGALLTTLEWKYSDTAATNHHHLQHDSSSCPFKFRSDSGELVISVQSTEAFQSEWQVKYVWQCL